MTRGGRGGEPPWAARRLLEAALPPDERAPVLGDLHETFSQRRSADGTWRAGVWYWRQAVSIAARFAVERVRERASLGRWEMRQALAAGWGRDLSHAARRLLRSPGFTTVTIATLALAIGANTAIFSVVETVLLDPLPFDESDRLVSIRGTAPGTDMADEFGLGAEFYVQYRENAAALADLAFHWGGQVTVRHGDRVERLSVTAAPPTLFTTLGVTPVIGRLPVERDEEYGVAVISHRLWTEWFGRDPAVLDRGPEIDGRLVDVVGVMGPEFRYPDERTDIWIHDLPTPPIRPGNFGFGMLGRLAPGEDHSSLASELAVLARRLPERFGGSPQYASIIKRHRPVVRSLEESLVGDVERPLWILLGTVGIVLLVACANVANLLLVRAEGRRQDLAVRRALGAGRGALVRSQMAEALLLAALGGAGGVLLAWLALPVLVRSAPDSIPRLSSTGIDATALLFTGGVVLLTALLAGLLPALRFSDPRLAGGLRQTSRAGGAPDHLVRDALVVLQTASALVLLVASALLLQSFGALGRVDPGYDTEDIFTFQAAPDRGEHGLTDAAALARFHSTFMDRLATLPGVESVGLIATLPLDEGAGTVEVAPEATAGQDVPRHRVHAAMVGGDYFRTMGIELLSGRILEPSEWVDPGETEVEVIVSRRTAELLWPGQDPLGRRLHVVTGGQGYWNRVAGVVEDVFLRDLRQEDVDPMLYLPLAGPVSTPAYVLRTERAEAIAPEVRALVREVTPEAPMYRAFTMRALAARSMASLSFTMITVAVAAGLALVLGVVGLFGVLSYVVSRRTREIGIRMALGARAGELRRMVVAEGGRVALAGVAVGLVAAAWLTRVLDSLLFGVEPTHAPTFAAVSLLMLAVALLASWVPARRASSVDPMRSLRAE